MSEAGKNGPDSGDGNVAGTDEGGPVWGRGEAPDLETAQGDWLVAERRQRMRIILWVLGGAAFVVVAFAIWFAVFRLPSIPVACEAAIQRIQKHCKVGRREAIKRIKKTPALVPDDASRRETCRVLATAEHKFWRNRAIKAMMAQAKNRPGQTGDGPKAARPGADKKPSEESLPGSAGKKKPEPISKLPVPTVIKPDGPLTDTAQIFIEQKLIPGMILRTYCPRK